MTEIRRGVFDEPGDNRIELSRVVEVALEARKTMQWCDTFWDVLRQKFGAVRPNPPKVQVSFVIDLNDSNNRYAAAAEYAGVNQTPVCDWGYDQFYRYFYWFRDYSQNPPVTVEILDQPSDPNAGVYVDRDYLIETADAIRRKRSWPYDHFWETMQKLGYEKPILNARRVTFEVTPGQQGIPVDFDWNTLTAQGLHALLERVISAGRVRTLDQINATVEEMVTENESASPAEEENKTEAETEVAILDF